MRILQAVGWYLPDSLGGTEVYVAALASRLKAAGHEVRVAAPQVGLSSPRSYEYEGIEVLRYPIPENPTRGEVRGDIVARGAEALHSWMSQLSPDVVHLHTFVTGLGLPEVRAARRVARRVVATTHSSSLGFLCERGTLMHWGTRACDGLCRPAKCAACALDARGLPGPVAVALAAIPPTIGTLALAWQGRGATALGMSALMRDNVRRQAELFQAVDRFVVLTQWAFDAIVANGFSREKLAVNRLGVSQRNLCRKPGPDLRPTRTPIRFGYLGRLDEIKGVRDLVRAVTSLPRECPIVLEICGPARTPAERSFKVELERLASRDPRISFADEVPPLRVPEVLARYDVLCCPSRCHEGGPTVALEAHAVGTVVIGARIGGLAEIVRDGVDGLLFEPANWRALASAIERIARDPLGTIDRWREAAPSPRTMDDVAADYLRLYQGPRAPR